MSSDVKLQNFLLDLTDALLSGESADTVRDYHDISRAESDDLVQLVQRVHHSMTPVKASYTFKRRLKADLLEQQQATVIGRIRRLPARVQLAAAAALIGGFLLIVQRFFLGDDNPNPSEESALQEKV